MVMKMDEKCLTVIASRPLNGRMELIYRIIYELGIEKKKSIHILNYDGNNCWFTENLIASLSGVDKNRVSAYFRPCEVVGKLYKENKDEEFLNAISLLQESAILMTDFVFQKVDKDALDYFLTYFKDTDTVVKDIYIINTFDMLLKRTKYSKEEVLKKITQFSNENKAEVFLITDAKDTKNLKIETILDYEDLEPYTKRFILSQKENKETLRILVQEETLQEYVCLLDSDSNRIGDAK